MPVDCQRVVANRNHVHDNLYYVVDRRSSVTVGRLSFAKHLAAPSKSPDSKPIVGTFLETDK